MIKGYFYFHTICFNHHHHVIVVAARTIGSQIAERFHLFTSVSLHFSSHKSLFILIVQEFFAPFFFFVCFIKGELGFPTSNYTGGSPPMAKIINGNGISEKRKISFKMRKLNGKGIMPLPPIVIHCRNRCILNKQ